LVMRNINKIILFIILDLVCLLHTSAFAKDINFEATVDSNKVELGQPFELNLTFNGTQYMPALEAPIIEGFQARYVGPSTRMSIINGQVSSSITHVYTLLPARKGTFQIGPFRFEHKGDVYNSNPITVEVVDVVALPQTPPAQAGGQPEAMDLNDQIFLIMQIGKNKIYLNEAVPVIIKLFVNKLGVRDIQYPQFSHDGFSAGEFGQPRQYREIVGGIGYDIIEFNTTVFGLKPGEFRLGPATMQCNLLVQRQNRGQAPPSPDNFFNSDFFNSFLGGYQAYPLNLKSTDIPVTVLSLPEENKPASFSGAMGIFDFEASVNLLEVKVGDPVTLKAIVRGQGNFNTVKFPATDLGDNFKAYEPQVKQENVTKIFEEVMIPLNDGIKEIPAVNFSFFNTGTGQYQTITRGPFPIKVIRSEKTEELQVVENKRSDTTLLKEEKLGRDIIYIKATSGKLTKKGEYLYKNKIFLGCQVLPLFLYLFIVVMHARNRRFKTDVRFARQLLAPRKARAGIRLAAGYFQKENVRDFYDALFDTMQEYLGDKFHLPSKGITISVIDEQLRSRGLPETILAKIEELFSECDMVRYAASQLTKEHMQNSLIKLEEVIDHLQRNKV